MYRIRQISYFELEQDYGIEEKSPDIAKLQNGHHYTSQYDGKGLIEETVMNRDMLNVMKLQ